MAAHTLTTFSPAQGNVLNSIYNAWVNSPYANNTNVLYQAVGIATGEGLDRANPMASNSDSHGTIAWGPFQLNNGGLGATFAQSAGVPIGGGTIDQQSNFVVNYIGAHGTSPWMSVNDTPGGLPAVTSVGQSTFNNAQSQGLISGSVGTSNPTTPDNDSVQYSGAGTAGGDAPDTIAMTGGTGQLGTASNADQYSGLTGGYTLSQGYNNDQFVTGAPGSEANNANSSPLGVGDTAYSGNLATPANTNPVANTTPVAPATGNPIQPTAAASSGASASTAPSGTAPSVSGGTGTGGGAPVNITDATTVGTQAAGTIAQGATTAANTISKALGGVTSGAGADTSSLESTGTGWLNSIFGDINSTLVRGGFIVAGLFVLLLAGLFFYLDARGNGGSTNVQVVPIPV